MLQELQYCNKELLVKPRTAMISISLRTLCLLYNALPLLSLMCGKFVQYLDTQATIDQKLLDIVIVIA